MLSEFHLNWDVVPDCSLLAHQILASKIREKMGKTRGVDENYPSTPDSPPTVL